MTDAIWAGVEVPHYHPCGHCKRRPNHWPCFDTSTESHQHEGSYHLCDWCERQLAAIDEEG